MKANPSQLRLMSDEELDREFSSPEHDESTRLFLLYERVRRLSRPARARPIIQWVTLLLALIAALLAGVSAWPVIEGFGEKEWFDF